VYYSPWGCKEADKLEIKLLSFIGSWRKQESSRKTSTSASLTIRKIKIKIAMKYHLMVVRMAIIRSLQITNAGECVE